MIKICPARTRRAESARAVTGRRCPHSGVGKTFWRVDRFFFTKTTVTRKRKVEKSIPKCEMDRLSGGYKRARDKIWGHMAKNGFSGREPSFLAQKKHPLLNSYHVQATTRKSCAIKKLPFSQINISLLANCGCFFWRKKIGHKTLFGKT